LPGKDSEAAGGSCPTELRVLVPTRAITPTGYLEFGKWLHPNGAGRISRGVGSTAPAGGNQIFSRSGLLFVSGMGGVHICSITRRTLNCVWDIVGRCSSIGSWAGADFTRLSSTIHAWTRRTLSPPKKVGSQGPVWPKSEVTEFCLHFAIIFFS